MTRLLCAAGLMAACSLAAAEDKPHHPTDPAGFVKMAAHGGMFEVESSRMAEKMTGNENVRKFAEHMIADHKKANAELKAAASAKGLAVPTTLDPKHEEMIGKLKNLSGAAFDSAYLKEQVVAHKHAVALFKAQAHHGEDPDLKAWAATTLPVLEKHLDHAEKLAHDHGHKHVE